MGRHGHRCKRGRACGRGGVVCWALCYHHLCRDLVLLGLLFNYKAVVYNGTTRLQWFWENAYADGMLEGG